MGVEPTIDVEIHDHPVQPDDIFLLCSDGLTDMVDDASIGRLLEQSAAKLDAAARALVENANENGGRDNISVVLIRVLSQQSGLVGRISRLVTRR